MAKKPQTITINGTQYEAEKLSESARNQVANLCALPIRRSSGSSSSWPFTRQLARPMLRRSPASCPKAKNKRHFQHPLLALKGWQRTVV